VILLKDNISSLQRNDLIFVTVLRACALTATVLTIFIFVFLALESAPAFKSISVLSFLTQSTWYPSEKQFGILSMALGSALVALLAICLAGPFGAAIAVFHHFAARRWMVTVSRRLLEAMAGIPSVIYGFWGLVVLVPRINAFRAPGQSLLAGGIVVGMMILPTMAMMTDSALTSLSSDLRRSAAALGLSETTTFFRLLLPRLRPGLIAAVTLSLGRALGETMAVLMVAGNIPQIPSSVFEPVRTLTANIALEMAYASGTHRSALFVSGLLLLGVSGVLAICVRAVAQKTSAGPSAGALAR
jgi:phosphate transport system permease protein